MGKLVEPLDDLKKLRKESGLKQSELGARLGRHKAWVSEVERGKRNPEDTDMQPYSNALGQPLRYKDDTVHEVKPR